MESRNVLRAALAVHGAVFLAVYGASVAMRSYPGPQTLLERLGGFSMMLWAWVFRPYLPVLVVDITACWQPSERAVLSPWSLVVDAALLLALWRLWSRLRVAKTSWFGVIQLLASLAVTHWLFFLMIWAGCRLGLTR